MVRSGWVTVAWVAAALFGLFGLVVSAGGVLMLLPYLQAGGCGGGG